MAGILDILNSDLGKSIISGVAGSTGNDTGKTENVLTMALPVLMKAMERNASTPQGAEGLMGALKKHDGGILDNLGDFFKGGVDKEVVQDGGNILGHILGNKQQGVEQVISKQAGIETGGVASILKSAAPLLMGLLGKQASEQKAQKPTDLSGILGGLLGGNETKKEQGFLEKILDADGDGSVMDDIAGLLGGAKGGAQNAAGGLADGIGGLLGGLFGKK